MELLAQKIPSSIKCSNLQCRSEFRTRPYLDWSKKVSFENGLDFKWNLKSSENVFLCESFSAKAFKKIYKYASDDDQQNECDFSKKYLKSFSASQSKKRKKKKEKRKKKN